MSIAAALGIVAIVNLALGYALAVVLEADRQRSTTGPIALPPSGTLSQGVAPLTPLPAPVVAPPVAKAAEFSAEPAVAQDVPDNAQTAQWSMELTELAAQINPASTVPPRTEPESPTAEPALASLAEQEPIVQPPPPDHVDSTAETIAQCEQLLDETETLLCEQAVDPPSEFNISQKQAEESSSATFEAAADNVEPPQPAPRFYEPPQPRATMLDVVQLDAVLNDWWQNDPSHSQPLCVAQIEIDNLRQLTADCGTTIAGNISKQLEDLLLAVLRSDDYLATLGKSRFLAMLPGLTAAESVKLIESARGQIEAIEFIEADRILYATITGAVAQVAAEETQEQLLARAAKGLSDARAAGRNRVAWHDGKTSQLVPAIEFGDRLQRVLG